MYLIIIVDGGWWWWMVDSGRQCAKCEGVERPTWASLKFSALWQVLTSPLTNSWISWNFFNFT